MQSHPSSPTAVSPEPQHQQRPSLPLQSLPPPSSYPLGPPPASSINSQPSPSTSIPSQHFSGLASIAHHRHKPAWLASQNNNPDNINSLRHPSLPPASNSIPLQVNSTPGPLSMAQDPASAPIVLPPIHPQQPQTSDPASANQPQPLPSPGPPPPQHQHSYLPGISQVSSRPPTYPPSTHSNPDSASSSPLASSSGGSAFEIPASYSASSDPSLTSTTTAPSSASVPPSILPPFIAVNSRRPPLLDKPLSSPSRIPPKQHPPSDVCSIAEPQGVPPAGAISSSSASSASTSSSSASSPSSASTATASSISGVVAPLSSGPRAVGLSPLTSLIHQHQHQQLNNPTSPPSDVISAVTNFTPAASSSKISTSRFYKSSSSSANSTTNPKLIPASSTKLSAMSVSSDSSASVDHHHQDTASEAATAAAPITAAAPSSPSSLLPSGKNRIRVAKACDRCKRRKTKCDGRYPCVSCAKTKSECIYTPSSFVRSTSSATGANKSYNSPGASSPDNPHHRHNRSPSPQQNLASVPAIANLLYEETPTTSSSNTTNTNHVSQSRRRKRSLSTANGDDHSPESPPDRPSGHMAPDLENCLANISSQLAQVASAITNSFSSQSSSSKPNQEEEKRAELDRQFEKISDISQMLDVYKLRKAPFPTHYFSKLRYSRRYLNFLPHQIGLSLYNSISERAREKVSVPRVQHYGWNMSGSHFLKTRSLDPGVELLDEDTTRYLLNYFFININPLYSIIHEPMFMKQYEAFLATSDKRECRLFMANLNIACATAMRFSEVIDRREYEPGLEEKLFDDGLSTMQAFSFEWESTEIIQGWLLITFYVRACYRQPAAWSSLCQAARMVQGMGLHKRTSFEIYLSDYDHLKRRSALWSCFSLERCLCVDFCRAFHFQEDQIAYSVPSSYKDNGWQSPLTYGLVKLGHTVRELCLDTEFRMPDDKVRATVKSLLEWNESMHELNLADDHLIGNTRYPIGLVAHVRLTYYNYIFFIYMRSVFSLVDKDMGDRYPDIKILTDAITGVNTVTDILEREKQLLAPWWYTLSSLFATECLCLLFISNNIQLNTMTAELAKAIRKVTLIAADGRFAMAKECLWSLKTLNHMLLTRMQESQRRLKEIGIDHGESSINNIRFFDMGFVDEKGVHQKPVVEVKSERKIPGMPSTPSQQQPITDTNIPPSGVMFGSQLPNIAADPTVTIDPEAPHASGTISSTNSSTVLHNPTLPFVDPVVSLDWFSNWTWEFESSLASYLTGPSESSQNV